MNPLKQKVSVIIPVYYNAESLKELVDRLQIVETILEKKQCELELIFVDDGSRDHSFEVLLDIKKQRPHTKLIRLTRNFGVVAASETGFPYATGDCIVMMPADLQDPPEQVLPMIEAWEEGHKVVFSCRRSRKDPWLTKIMAAGYYRLLEALVVKGFPKGGVGITLIDRTVMSYMRPQGRVNNSLYLFWLGFKVKELPYDRQERRHGKSRWTFKKKFFYFLDNITGFSVTPLRLVSFIGLGVSFICLAYGLKLIFSALVNGVEVPGFVTLAVLISFSTSIIVTILSIIGEYLWRVFEIVTHQPKSVIAETYLEPMIPVRRD